MDRRSALFGRQSFSFGSRRESIYNGDALGSSTSGSSSRYPNSRKTLAPSQPPFLPALDRCVASMDKSAQLLKSTVARLDQATSRYPRLDTITSHTKTFELVSEQDIASARVEVAREVEPQLFSLTEKAVDIVKDLEAEERRLVEEVRLESDKQIYRVQQREAVRSGLSNIKKLQSLTRRKEELSKSVAELDEVLEQKRQEFSQLMDMANSDESRSIKRMRRNPNNELQELHQKAEGRRKEIARRKQELTARKLKIEDMRQALRQLRTRQDPLNSGSTSEQDNFNPTVPWNMYTRHQDFLEKALKTGLDVDVRDSSVYEETFARIIAPYLRELNSRQAETDKVLNKLTRDKTRKLSHMRNLCKQLFPEENIGHTMVRVLELLVESTDNELYYNELVQNEFPAEEERRHNLSRVVTILKQVGVIEVVLESGEERDNEDDHDGEPRKTEGQLVLRIKFEESN